MYLRETKSEHKENVYVKNQGTLHVALSKFGTIKKKAEFDISDLTIICGHNNSGKTYATYAVFGFMVFWQRYVATGVFAQKELSEFVKNRVLEKPLSSFDVNKILHDASQVYSQPESLARVFGANKSFFRGAMFDLSIRDYMFPITGTGDVTFDIGDGYCRGKLSWKICDGNIRIELLDCAGRINEFRGIYRQFLNDCVKQALLGNYFPKTYIACAERTGAVIFQKELDFTSNRLVQMLKEKSLQAFPFLDTFATKYPLPVRLNVDVARSIPDDGDSFLVDEKDVNKGNLLRLFEDIIGGKFKVARGQMRFVPRNNSSLRLDMILSSSSIRSLMHLGVYLRYQLKRGDMLIVDEPEQNLHPDNQRKMARLLVMLSNFGVRVLITTHSDYIIREINTLMMMNNSNAAIDKIKSKYGYFSNEKCSIGNVKVYCAGNDDVHQMSNSQNWFKEADISNDTGINAEIFDDTISAMNEIQSELIMSIA